MAASRTAFFGPGCLSFVCPLGRMQECAKREQSDKEKRDHNTHSMEQTATMFFCDDEDDDGAGGGTPGKEHEYGTYPLPLHKEHEYDPLPLPLSDY